LQYFDVVALIELGSGTFGKTGTNTVVLFLRRKHQLPEPAEHYRNRVEDWFDNDVEMEAYQDLHFIKKYCEHIAIPFEHYQTLLHGEPSAELLACELFQDYKKDFDQSNDIKKLASQTFFKDYSPEQKQTELKKRFLVYLQKIEKDKLFYFVLAYTNPQQVLIVKSPSDNKEQKQFLGYEWSAAKGNEGIKLTTDAHGNHLTPLYDPGNRYNPYKINTLIQQNFSGNEINLSGLKDLTGLVTMAKLVDLLDFSRKDFDKHISLSPKKKISIESKWESVKIGNLNALLKRGKSTKYGNSNIQVIKSGQARGFKEFDFTEKYFAIDTFQSDERNLQKGDLLINSTGVGTAGRVTLFELDGDFVADSHITIFRPNETFLSEYALQCFSHIGFKTIEQMAKGLSGQIELTIPTIEEIHIPLPPLEIQSKIVQECNAIDAEVTASQGNIEHAARELERIKTEVFSKGVTQKKVSDCALINPSKTEIRHVDENTLISFVEMASVNEAGFINRKEDRSLKDLKKGSYTYFKENDIIIAKITPCMENGKCAFATDLTNGLAMGSSEFHVIRANEEVVLGKYIFALLNRESVRKEAEKNMTGSSGHRRVPASFYENYRIPVPGLTTQQQLITEIATHETSITAVQTIIDVAASKKQAILKKYL
jgi:restriction endonuclease S subunit